VPGSGTHYRQQHFSIHPRRTPSFFKVFVFPSTTDTVLFLKRQADPIWPPKDDQ